MSIVKVDYGTVGKVDISDLIGNTYTIATGNVAGRATFLVGINSISAKVDTAFTIGMYSDAACTQLIQEYNNSSAIETDVSDYNVVYLKSNTSAPRLLVTVLS